MSPEFHQNSNGFEIQQEVSKSKVVKSVLLHLVPPCFVAALFCYCDRANLAFASTQIQQDLHLSTAQYGAGAGILFLGYSVMQVPSNFILSRVGAKRWLSFVIIAWGCIAVASAALQTSAQFMALRVLLGAAEAGTFPGIHYHLGLFLQPHEQGYAYALICTSTALSQVVGGPMAALIMLLDGVGIRGWRWLLLLEGLPSLAVGLYILWFLAPNPAGAKYLTPAEREFLQQRQTKLTEAAPLAEPLLQPIWDCMRDWRVWLLGLVWVLTETSIYGILFFCPLLIQSLLSKNEADTTESWLWRHEESGSAEEASRLALLSAVVFAPAAVGMAAVGKLSQRANEQRWHGFTVLVLGGVSLMLMLPAITCLGPVAGFLLLICAATFIWSIHGPFYSLPSQFLSGSRAAVGVAFINTVGAVGGFVGPLLLGLSTQQWTTLVIFGIFDILAALLLLAMPHQTLPAQDEKLQDPEQMPMLEPLPFEHIFIPTVAK